MATMNKPIILIPAYMPGTALLKLINELIFTHPSDKIIVINDGSGKDFQNIFNEIRKLKIIVLEHAINMGKGAALKTGFNHVLVNHGNNSSVITVDADGQHAPIDVDKIIDWIEKNHTDFCMGVRKFDTKVPLRSKFGNSITRTIFKLFTGKSISDTQTGLRGVPNYMLPTLLKIQSNGYEYELEMLLEAVYSKAKIKEIEIKTIYENNNSSSHFNPILDSLKIYFVFFRFSVISLLTAGIDLITFVISYSLLSSVFLAIFISRVVAGIFNFTMAKKYVFKSGEDTIPELLKYIITLIVLMLISVNLINFLVSAININVYVSKIISEIILFLLSFVIQRTVVFGRIRL